MENSIGRKIDRILKERAISQRQLAKAAGISNATVSRCIWGEKNPQLDTLRKIAKALNITVKDLVGEAADTNTDAAGIWLEKEVFDDSSVTIDQWQSAKCSKCGKYYTTPYMYYFTHYNFCPNCGHAMRGKQNGQ